MRESGGQNYIDILKNGSFNVAWKKESEIKTAEGV